jgi:flavin reductase (DIM6/NTAB) family NADH-FMN oxidoreductase RutF
VSIFQRADPAVYLVSARAGDERGGMIASWVTQATLSAEQPRVLAVISIETRTQRLIEASGRFALQLLDESQSEVVARFALPPPAGTDKWDGFDAAQTGAGLPLVAGGCGFAECEVVDRLHTGDRVVYLADVIEQHTEPGRQPLRESAALARQSEPAARALAESYALDVQRDGHLLRSKREG